MTQPRESIVREPNAWHGDSFRPLEWVRHLEPDMIGEIRDAVGAAERSGKPPTSLVAADFPLPRTAEMITAVAEDMEDGRGFVVLRGWPVQEFTYEQNVTAFCGVAAHLGRMVPQNREGRMLQDVVDVGQPISAANRGYLGHDLIPFHCDGADIAGLMCLAESAAGGESLLASGTALYNAIAAEAPEHLPILERGFHHHRRGEQAPGEPPISPDPIPVFARYGGLLHCFYNRNAINWCAKEGIVFSEAELAALDCVDRALSRPEMVLRTTFRQGDMQFLNNFTVLHSRTEYVDDATHRRHLLRLWIDTPASKRSGHSLLSLYLPEAARFGGHAAR